ncbi:MAG: flavodoxin family protein [Candidatus Hodarchaeota archaeon]
MKTAIIYRSFLGTTRKYAEWLHESVESDLFKPRQINKSKLQEYDLVILCSGTYAGWISIRGYLKKRWEALQGKKVVLLVIGIAPPEDADSIKSFEKIPENIRNGIKYFKLPGTIGASNAAQVKKENLQPVLDYINTLAA